MPFHSYIFILAFFPAVIISYFLANKINSLAGKMILIASSLIFYGYAGETFLLFLAASAVINYLFILLIKRYPWQKLFLAVPITINVGLLLYLKYLNFAIENLNTFFKMALPPPKNFCFL